MVRAYRSWPSSLLRRDAAWHGLDFHARHIGPTVSCSMTRKARHEVLAVALRHLRTHVVEDLGARVAVRISAESPKPMLEQGAEGSFGCSIRAGNAPLRSAALAPFAGMGHGLTSKPSGNGV